MFLVFLERVNMIYKDKRMCTACEACVNICPFSAISFKRDESGFEYPVIDQHKCVNCGLCEKVCPTRNDIRFHKAIETKVVVLKNKLELHNSSSGGLFYGLAKSVIENGGIVSGSSYSLENGRIQVVHKLVSNINEIKDLQGSKYSRSHIGDSFKIIKEYLEEDKIVLFTGTPCQVSALKCYLKKDYENLFTADLICHGVPEQLLFNNYLDFLGKKYNGVVEDFCFRNKKYGWGLTGSCIIRKKNNKTKTIRIPYMLSSYYHLFIRGSIYRENCYSCLYAKGDRVSDITMGDYWGIHDEHPELLKGNGGEIDPSKGVSCAIINTEKGIQLLEKARDSFLVFESSIEKAQKHNHQLKYPTKKPSDFSLYYGASNEFFEDVDKLFWNNNKKNIYKTKYWKSRVKSWIPQSFKNKIKRIVK